MKALAVIPARFASSRFPGKPLCLIDGRTMISRVYEAVVASEIFDDVIVATDDDRILEEVNRIGGKVQMTASDHQTGTDRVAEVASRESHFELVANIQGDQPFVTTEALKALLAGFQNNRIDMATIACPLAGTEINNPNTVKVICNQLHEAIIFTRSSQCPFQCVTTNGIPRYHHLGLYAFRREFLLRFSQLPATPLERAEELEQLRALEHGFRIGVGFIDEPLPEVNSPEDLRTIQADLTRGFYAKVQESDSDHSR